MDKKEDKKKTRYFDELMKFIGDDVEIILYKPDGNYEQLTGRLLAINFQHLNLILMTDKEKILIRNFVTVRRKRDTSDRKGKK